MGLPKTSSGARFGMRICIKYFVSAGRSRIGGISSREPVKPVPACLASRRYAAVCCKKVARAWFQFALHAIRRRVQAWPSATIEMFRTIEQGLRQKSTGLRFPGRESETEDSRSRRVEGRGFARLPSIEIQCRKRSEVLGLS